MTLVEEKQLRHLRLVAGKPSQLPIVIDEPDSAVVHAVGLQLAWLVVDKGRHPTRHGNLRCDDVVKTLHLMHAPPTVEQQRSVVEETCTSDREVKTPCADHFFCSHIKQSQAVLADNEQLTTFIHGLQTERSDDIFQIDDTRLAAIGDHQMACMAKGITLPVAGCIDIPEAVVLVVNQRRSLQMPAMHFMFL